MKYLYLVIEIGVIIIPLAFSFDKKLMFYKNFKTLALSMSLVAAFYIIWDIYFTKNNIWGFNTYYYSSLTLIGLPIEEWLFFFIVPYASIFIHQSLILYFPKVELSVSTTNIITYALIVLFIILSIFYYKHIYTLFNAILVLSVLIVSLYTKTRLLNKFYLSFLIILIPFLIVNGILTGSYIRNEIVWYNADAIIGIRISTIPIEDVSYAFNLLFFNLFLFDKLTSMKNVNTKLTQHAL